MSKKQKLIIEFTPAQTKKYLELAGAKTQGELDEDCLPSGMSILIDICPFGDSASVGDIDLGEVKVDLIDA